jgi:hypothetical protein
MVNPCLPITWVLSSEAFNSDPHAAAVATCYDVTVVFTNNFESDPYLKQLQAAFFLSGNMSSSHGTPTDFNLITLSRMFYVRAYMAAAAQQRRVFHLENDNMNYEPLAPLDAAYQQCGFVLAAPIRDLKFTVLGFAYLASAKALTTMVEYYVAVLEQGKEKVKRKLHTIWINDMSLTASYIKDHPSKFSILPVRPDTRFSNPNCGFDRTGSLVDGASVAVYHLGDFHKKTPFANKKGWGSYQTFDPIPFDLQWHLREYVDLEVACTQPVLVPKDGVGPPLRFVNLHVHHKALQQTRGACLSRATTAYTDHLAALPWLGHTLEADLAGQTALLDNVDGTTAKGMDRRPSYPLITGDGFRAACGRWCGVDGCNFRPSDVVRGDCIFLDTTNLRTKRTTVEYVQRFVRDTLGQIAKPVVVVTHNGDVSMPDGDSHAPYEPHWPTETFSGALSHPNITRWLATNCYWTGVESGATRPHNLECIPIGVENRYNRIGSHPEVYFRAMKGGRVVQDGHHLLVAFTPHRLKPGRARALEALNQSWVTRRSGSRQQWIRDVQSHRFTLCPHGHGLDSHRTWEVLLLGGVPIVRSSTLDSMYDGLPVVIVTDWADVTEARLEAAWQWVQTTPFQMDRMFWPYWAGRLELARAASKSWGVPHT